MVLAAYSAYGFILFGGFLKDTQWDFVTSTSTLMNIISTSPQIWTNFKRKSTGQMAYISYFMNFFGSIARLGTVLYESDDLMVKVQYLISCGLGLIYQM